MLSDTATAVYIEAEIAHECLRSVPNYQDAALRLLNSLRAYLEFQSTKEILKTPPKGWLFPPVDLDYGMDAIQEKVEAEEYESEYAFQLDIVTLLGSARDGHLAWNGDLMSAFSFRRRANVAAISSDGVQLPQIYHLCTSRPWVIAKRCANEIQPILLPWTMMVNATYQSRATVHHQL